MNKGNTPTLTQSEEARAPWNDKQTPAISFPMRISETLTKRCDIETDEYTESCDGNLDLSDVNWKGAYTHSCFTLTELLGELGQYIEAEINAPTTSNQRKEYLRKMLADSKGWEVDDIEVEED